MKTYETLRNKRIELGISQKYVGENIKVAQSTICRFENGYNVASNQLLIHKLMKFYNSFNEPVNSGIRIGIGNRKKTEQPKQEKKKAVEPKIEQQPRKNNIDIMGEEFAKKFEEAMAEELEKQYKKMLKKSLKRALKEM